MIRGEVFLHLSYTACCCCKRDPWSKTSTPLEQTMQTWPNIAQQLDSEWGTGAVLLTRSQECHHRRCVTMNSWTSDNLSLREQHHQHFLKLLMELLQCGAVHSASPVSACVSLMQEKLYHTVQPAARAVAE